MEQLTQVTVVWSGARRDVSLTQPWLFHHCPLCGEFRLLDEDRQGRVFCNVCAASWRDGTEDTAGESEPEAPEDTP